MYDIKSKILVKWKARKKWQIQPTKEYVFHFQEKKKKVNTKYYIKNFIY